MKTAVYVGNFDPVTLGHVDVIRRASHVAERLVIGVCNQEPDRYRFSFEERMKYLTLALPHLGNVVLQECRQDTVSFAKSNGAKLMVRGVRNSVEFEHELHRAQVNQKMEPEMETLLFMTSWEYSFLSSKIVRELLEFGQDISYFVPSAVADMIKKTEMADWRIKNGQEDYISRGLPYGNWIHGGSSEYNPSPGAGSDCY